jgi:hypothetical protein
MVPPATVSAVAGVCIGLVVEIKLARPADSAAFYATSSIGCGCYAASA